MLAYARKKGIVKLNRDIMGSINRVAHLLAQKHYAEQRNTLATGCKEMLAAGKTRTEIDIYLAEVATSSQYPTTVK